MTVRAKMICTEKKGVVSQYSPAQKPTAVVVLRAVTAEENKTWAKYTPSGSVELQIDNTDAYDAFELGRAYFVDFTSAPLTEAEEKH